MSGELNELSDLIAKCAESAFMELFKNGEHYYYCVLITTGEGFAPFISAWSKESLDKMKDELSHDALKMVKWSYADAAYCNFGEEYFEPVKALFSKRPSIHETSDESWAQELQLRLSAMELALKKLDHEGLFGLNQSRSEIYINVELVPPDVSNTDRALRLNKKEHIMDWIEEAAE